jgi:hypothetical protein
MVLLKMVNNRGKALFVEEKTVDETSSFLLC